MNESERYLKGMAVRREVLGDAWVDRAQANRTPFNTDFQEFITRYAWGDLWAREGMDRKTRSCVVLGIAVALGRWEEFRLHVRAAFNNGLTEDDIKEVLMTVAVYAGVPAANTAFKEAAEVFAERARASPHTRL